VGREIEDLNLQLTQVHSVGRPTGGDLLAVGRPCGVCFLAILRKEFQGRAALMSR